MKAPDWPGRLVGMIAVLVVLLAADRLGRAGEQTDDAKAIRKVLDDQQRAWNAADLEGFMAGYWKSPKLTFFSGGNKTFGWDKTLERYRKRYQGEGREMGKLTFSEIEVGLLGGDSAYATGRWKVETSKEKMDGLFTLLLKKLPEGWRIVHDHTSVAEAVP